jgi:hypothetical protein
MCAGEHLVATGALAARIEGFLGPPLAEHPLGKTQRQHPLADSRRADKQKRAGQPAAGERMAKAGEDLIVAAEHGEGFRVQGSGK